MYTSLRELVGLCSMVFEVSEESDWLGGFLWSSVIADLYDIIRKRTEQEALKPCIFFYEELSPIY